MKTVATAVDAATAQNPSSEAAGAPANVDRAAMAQPRGAGAAQAEERPVAHIPTSKSPQAVAAKSVQSVAARSVQTLAQTVAQSREVRKGLKRGTRRFGEAVWAPVVRLSGVLWLEVAGVLFGIFAVFAGGHLWELRGAWHSDGTHSGELRSFAGALAMLVLFAYFCVSSFVRARRRERRR